MRALHLEPPATGEAWAVRPWRRLRAAAPMLPIVVYLGAFFILPVAQLLFLSVADAKGAPTLEHYDRLFSSATYVRVLGTTFSFAAWTTLICIVAGYPLAYLIATVPEQRRNTLILWVLLPFWTSFLVRTFAWIVLLGRTGAINRWLQGLGIADGPLPLIYNSGSVLVGLAHAMMPLAVLTMTAVMQTIDRRLVSAARTLGARGGQSFWRIYFPLSMPGVAAAGILVFVSTLGFFVTPALLGSGRDVMISQIIIEQINELNWAFGGALGVLLLVAALVTFVLYDRVFGLSSLAATSGAEIKSARPGVASRVFGGALKAFIGMMGWISDRLGELADRFRPVHSNRTVANRGRRSVWVIGLLALFFLAGPSFFVIPISFTDGSFLEWPPRGFSLKWYEDFFSSPIWLAAILRSLAVGLACAILTMAIGVPAAFYIVRGSTRARSAVIAFVLSPLIVPRIIIAIALFYLYARLGLVGTSLGLVLGHAVLALPYVVIAVMAVLKNYDHRLDQAARSLGASKSATLRHVTLPLIRPGLIAAFLFAFVISFDEITIALFVTGGLTTTLPKLMWDGALLSVTPIVTAASTITLLLVTALILIAQYLERRAVRRRAAGSAS